MKRCIVIAQGGLYKDSCSGRQGVTKRGYAEDSVRSIGGLGLEYLPYLTLWNGFIASTT